MAYEEAGAAGGGGGGSGSGCGGDSRFASSPYKRSSKTLSFNLLYVPFSLVVVVWTSLLRKKLAFFFFAVSSLSLSPPSTRRASVTDSSGRD